ncbi:MAG: hypothetical protein L6R28_25210 [Planctomycetes bacterium]|nr:hypothetical protein [Planctomycetota bacterium]
MDVLSIEHRAKASISERRVLVSASGPAKPGACAEHRDGGRWWLLPLLPVFWALSLAWAVGDVFRSPRRRRVSR